LIEHIIKINFKQDTKQIIFATPLESLPNDSSGLLSHKTVAIKYNYLHSTLILKLDDPKRPQETQITESWTASIIDECINA